MDTGLGRMVLVVGLAATSLAAQESKASAPTEPKGVLELVSGERIAGRLAARAKDAGFTWVSPVFRTPLAFAAAALSLVTFDPDAATYEAKGSYRVVLANGDAIMADLAGIDAAAVSLATQRHGELVIPRTAIAALTRRVGGTSVYLGPNSVLEWRKRKDEPVTQWRASGTSLVTTQVGAEIFRDRVLAADCRVECSLSWVGRPGFRIVLGASADPALDTGAVVVEVWDDLLVAFRERESRIDVMELPVTLREQGSTTLRVSVRRAEGQPASVTFHDEKGAELGNLQMEGAAAGIAIRQKGGGELRLDRLAVERLYGAGEPAPRSLQASEVRGYVAAEDAFVVGEEKTPAAGIDAILFAAAKPAEAEESTELLLQDGTRIRGEYAGLAAGRLNVKVAWLGEPVATTVDALKSLRVSGNTKPRLQEQFKLGIKEDRFLGKIVSLGPEDGTLLWQPTLGREPAILQSRDDLRLDLASTSAYFASRKDYPHRILLTNHDCFPCKILAITPDTVTFLEPFHGKRREVSAAVVKALELDPQAVPRVADDARIVAPANQDSAARRNSLLEARKLRDRGFIDSGRRETILSLPRRYKGTPPTHLLVAANGDVLRGVLASVTDQAVSLDATLTGGTAVPRDKVVAMVLFPAGEQKDPLAAQDGDKRLVLELALDKETRVTLRVVGATAQSITGTSPFLGEVTISSADVVSMVSGGLRGKAPGFFSSWKLVPMKEPQY